MTKSMTISSPIGGRRSRSRAATRCPSITGFTWQDQEPGYPADMARVVATRIGRAGIPGAESWDANARKFALDFEGGDLATMAPRFDIKPVVTASSGAATDAYVIKVVGTNRWRALFDVPVDGKPPVDLRCYLRAGRQDLERNLDLSVFRVSYNAAIYECCQARYGKKQAAPSTVANPVLRPAPARWLSGSKSTAPI